MKAALNAEFRKLLTVRATYVLSILSLLFAGFIAFWGIGYKNSPYLLAQPNALQNAAMDTVMFTSILVGILAILLICHEYRYNTITYTLTASNSRLRVLFAKFTVMSIYAAVMTVLALVLGILLVQAGASMAGHDMGRQSIHIFDLLWRTLAFMVGNVWLGLIIGFLARSVVFAVTAYFVLPAIESLLNNFLKLSNNYLPSASQTQILQTVSNPDMFSPLASAGVFAIYLAIGIAVSCILFVRRDAGS